MTQSRAGKDDDQVRVPLSALAPDPDNPRRMSDVARQGLAVSLETFGPLDIVFNTRTGQLVSGHQRIAALKEAGAVEVVRTGEGGYDDGYIVHPNTGERFHVRFVDWDETKHRMANLVANNPHLQGEFTEDALAQLKELESETGFDLLALDELEKELADELGDPESAGGNCDQDDVPEPPVEPFSKRGDLWLLGDHRLLCGDSTNAEDVARLMGDERAGLMNTDPPYGVAYANDERPNPGVAKPRVAKPRVANDDLSDEVLQEFLEAAFKPAVAVALKENAAWYLWHAHLTQGYFAAAAAAAAANVVLHRQIIWVKPVLLLGRGQYHWKHEPAFMGWVKGHQPPDYGEGNGERTQTTVWEIGSVTQAERKEFNHSSPKPVGLFEIPIIKHLRSGEVSYEPFAGSGPQIIAAEMHGRRCFAMELEPRYVDVVVARWEKFTGKKAVKSDG